LRAEELAAFQTGMRAWNTREYGRRLAAQDRGDLIQVVAWRDGRPVGKAMVLFPGYEEYSVSAEREGCAEIRDVNVVPDARRRGIATAMIVVLERAVRTRGLPRIGLSVALDDDDAPARELYGRLGYAFAHGPFVSSTNLVADDGSPVPVGAVMTYLTKPLAGSIGDGP